MMSEISSLVSLQRSAYQKDLTHILSLNSSNEIWSGNYKKRKTLLLNLKDLIIQHEKDILTALYQDLGKSAGEAYMTETGMVLSELNFTIKHLKSWMKPKRVRSSLSVFPGKSMIFREPYGLVLIMSPWNYPFLLTMVPLIAAIAAGNRCIVKPSNYSPATSQTIADLVNKWVLAEQAAVVLGGREENQNLLEEKFDYIFFTGGAEVGQLVMQKAAEHLTPLTLELGGKSPCIVDESADLEMTAKRIAFGKGINAGQTCIAPDYLLVHESVIGTLLPMIRDYWLKFYGEEPIKSVYWPKIVNKKHYDRLMKLLDQADIFYGGTGDGERISPTLLQNVDWADPIMKEEIFGPILPIITYNSIEDIVNKINQRDHPLALYVFSETQEHIDMLIHALPFGGGCINDTLIHLSNPHLPFGGLGKSGMGRYHGKYSFDTFSHDKSILFKGKTDFPFRYMPLNEQKTALLKQFLK